MVVRRAVVKGLLWRGEVEELGLAVVSGKGPSLLGQDWWLDWRKIGMLNTTPDEFEAVLVTHSDLYRDKLGTIRGNTAKLHVSFSTKTTIPVPFRMPLGLE